MKIYGTTVEIIYIGTASEVTTRKWFVIGVTEFYTVRVNEVCKKYDGSISRTYQGHGKEIFDSYTKNKEKQKMIKLMDSFLGLDPVTRPKNSLLKLLDIIKKYLIQRYYK